MKKLFIILAPIAVVGLIAVGVAHLGSLRAQAALDKCVSILRTINGCKQQWALESKADADALPNWDDLRPYVKEAVPPHWAHCPGGGSYTIGRMSEFPSCSIAPHTAAFNEYVHMPSNHSLQATATRLWRGAWATRMGVRLPGGSRRPVRVAVPEFQRWRKMMAS
jgi:hypothetical protein